MTNEQLVIRIKAGIDVADNMLQLWQQNQGFINKIASRYRGYEELEDLVQEGYIGLYHAVDGYNPDEGVSFLHYAAFWIQQSMQRYIENCGAVVRIPTHARGRIGKYKKLCAAFEKHYGRKPTDHEICYYLGVIGEVLASIKETAKMAEIGSLDSPVKNQEGELTVGDAVAAPVDVEEAIVEKIQTEQLKEVLWPLVDALSGQQPEVIRARYIEGLTLQATGEKLGGITRERVRQLEAKGMRALREPDKAKKLTPFLDEVIYSKALRGGGVQRFHDTWTSSTERVALQNSF